MMAKAAATKQIEAEYDHVSERIDKLALDADDWESQLEDANEEVKQISQDLKKAVNLVTGLTAKIRKTDAEIASLKTRQKQLEAAYDL